MTPATPYPRVLCHLAPASDDLLACDDPDGLTRVAIWALAQDRRGCIWAGTDEGPVRFDGMGWDAPSGLGALGSRLVWGIDAQEADGLWLGTDGAGLWHIDHLANPARVRAVLTTEQGLPDDDIHYLCRDHRGALWVASHHGLAVLDGDRVRARFTSQDGIPAAGICCLHADDRGRVWAGSLHGLLRIEDGALRDHVTTQQGLPDDRVYALATDSAGRLWVGTRAGICVMADGAATVYIRDDLPASEVRALCPDPEGRMWVGTARGLALVQDLKVSRRWSRAEGLPSSSVWTLLRDRDRGIWIGTESGLALARLSAGPVYRCRSYTQEIGTAFAFAADQYHRVWIGTSSGLMKADPNNYALSPVLRQPSILVEAAAWCVMFDDAGNLWTGGRFGGLFCLDPLSSRPVCRITELDAATCLCPSAEGGVWVGTAGAGLFRVDRRSGRITDHLGPARGLSGDHVSALCLDWTGRLWVGTLGGGLIFIQHAPDADLQVSPPIEGLPSPFITGLTVDQGGQLWGATQGGLFRLDPGTCRVTGVWTVADGLPTNMLVSCAFDRQGALWLGTTRGLIRFQPATGFCIALGRPHGMPSENCQMAALLLDSQDRLWVGTPDGAAVVVPSEIPFAIPPCTVFLTGLWCMGQELDLSAPITIDDAQYEVAITFAAIEFTAPAQVVYRTRLDGLDAGWSEARSHRFVRYTNLRPGEYSFQVCARNWGGQWSAPAVLGITVVRNQRARELEEALERERVETEVQRATAQRLDELNRSLITMQLLQTSLLTQLREQHRALQHRADLDGLTGILNRQASEALCVSAIANARRHLRPLSVALMDIDGFKEINDTFSHLTGDTVLRTVASLWRRHLRADDVLGRFGGDEMLIVFPDTGEDEAVLACERCREAVAAYPWDGIAPGLAVTISIGVREYQPGDDFHRLLEVADRQLYQAKARGRNRTCREETDYQPGVGA